MSEIIDVIKEAVKQIVARTVTVVAAVVVSSQGVDAIINYVVAPSSSSAAALKILSLGAAYAIWVQAVLPVVEWAFTKLKNQVAPSTTASGPKKSYFDLV